MRTRMFGSIVFVLLALPATRQAQGAAFVITPPIGAASTSTYVCKAVNTGGSAASVTFRIKDETGATLVSPQMESIGVAQAKSLAATGDGDIAYCEVEANSNAVADDLRVNLFVRDSAGNAVSSVSGSRLGLSTTYNQTPGLQTDDDRLVCYTVNTSASNTVSLLMSIRSDTLTTLHSDSVDLGPGDVFTLGASGTAALSGTCAVWTNSGTDGGRLRTSFSARSGSGDTHSPVQQP